MNEDREKVMKSGFTAHLTKPIDQQTLWNSLMDLNAQEGWLMH